VGLRREYRTGIGMDERRESGKLEKRSEEEASMESRGSAWRKSDYYKSGKENANY